MLVTERHLATHVAEGDEEPPEVAAGVALEILLQLGVVLLLVDGAERADLAIVARAQHLDQDLSHDFGSLNELVRST